MNRRARALAFAALWPLSACVGTGGPGDGGGERIGGEITVMVWAEPVEAEVYQDVVDAFEREEPRVDVNLLPIPDREVLLQRLSTSFAAGDPPDLFLLNYRYVGQYAARGALEALDERLDASTALDREAFYDVAMEAFRFDGQQMCMPQNVSSLVVYFNRDLFREAQVPEPEPGWDFYEMVTRARALTVDENGDGRPERYGLGADPSIIRIAPFIWSNGGALVDDEDTPTRLAVDQPAAAEVMQAYFDLRERHLVVPTEREIEAQDNEDRFLNGTTAMILASRRETPSFRTITDFEWDVAPLPVLREPAGVLHSDAYCMPRQGDNKASAWRFMEFALGPEGQRITAEAGRTVPSLIEVANSEAFLDPTRPPANSRVFLDTIPAIRILPTISTWPEIEDRADEILELGMYHQIPAPDVAQRLISETTPMFARAR